MFVLWKIKWLCNKTAKIILSNNAEWPKDLGPYSQHLMEQHILDTSAGKQQS
jgi:hypothetical protein